MFNGLCATRNEEYHGLVEKGFRITCLPFGLCSGFFVVNLLIFVN